eukprot:c25520_g1_i1 orf=489-1793(-)
MVILRVEYKRIKAHLVLSLSFLLVCAAQLCSGDFPAHGHLPSLRRGRKIDHLLEAEAAASDTLRAFGSEVVVLVANDQLKTFCKSKAFATQWVKENIQDQTANMNIVGVAVGKQVLTRRRDLFPFLLPAMKAIHAALTDLHLDHYIKVSTLVSSNAFTLLGPSSPPGFGNCSTCARVGEYLDSMLRFLFLTRSYIMLEGVSHSRQNGGDAIQAAFRIMSALGYRDIPVVAAEDLLCRRLYNSPVNDKFDSLLESVSLPVPIRNSGFEQWENFTIHCAGSILSTIREQTYKVDVFRRRMLLQYISTPKRTWCVAIEGIDDSTLQAALDYACGQAAADCEPIKFGNPCFLPNTVRAHASYVFNSNYQRNARNSGTCSFSGAGMVTTSDPSHGSCEFPFSGSLNQTTMVIQKNGATEWMVRLDILVLLYLSLALLSW